MKTIGKKALQVTSVLQYAGLKALALKVSSFLVAKKSFRFHFFCNLGSGKLFCLVQFLIELLGVKARTSQSRFPLVAMPSQNKEQ